MLGPRRGRRRLTACGRRLHGLGWVGFISLACTASGYVSLSDPLPPGEARPLRAALRALCGDYELTFVETFNGDVEPEVAGDGNARAVEVRAERERLELMIGETGLVGFIGQAGLAGRRLMLRVERQVDASIPHAIGSALTLFLFPHWVDVTYEVKAKILEGDRLLAKASASSSWSVFVQPFMVFAMPFDDPVNPVAIVEHLGENALSQLVMRSCAER